MITVVAPHPDDAELGASVFLRPGTQIVLVTGDAERELEQRKAASIAGVDEVGALRFWEGGISATLGLVAELEGYVATSGVVLSPPALDIHQDHRAVSDAVRSAVRRSPTTLLEYETPSTAASWEPNVFVPITEAELERQWMMLEAFVTQRDRPYVSKRWLEGRAMSHGMRVGSLYAQAFRIVTGTLPIPNPEG